jgi:hypothetical protein
MAPAVSKFLDDACAERIGLMDFIQRRFPDQPDLLVIKPVEADGPLKGFFPAGKICTIFEKQFFRWKTQFTRKDREENASKAFLRRLLLRLNAERDIPHGDVARELTLDDLIVTQRGGRDAGGASYIHPRLMTHFLMWCCPEFAEEVIDTFHRYLRGDPAVAAEAYEARVRVHTERIAQLEGDVEKQAELNQRYIEQLDEDQKRMDVMRQEATGTQERLQRDLEAVQAEKDRYEAMLQLRAEREAQLQKTLEEMQSPLNVLDPRNVLRDVEDPMHQDRHTLPQIHFYARYVTNVIGIALSQYMYRVFVSEVFTWTPMINKEHERKKIAEMMLDVKRFKEAKRLVKNWYRQLDERRRKRTMIHLKERVVDLIERIMGKDTAPEDDAIPNRSVYNPVDLTKLACTALKRSIMGVVNDPVQYSTECMVQHYAELAERFNDVAADLEIPVSLLAL